MAKRGWDCPLARPVGVKGGPDLQTLADVRAYLLTLSEGEQSEPLWQSVARRLLIACQTGDVEAFTEQLELALLRRAKLVSRPQDLLIGSSKRIEPPHCIQTRAYDGYGLFRP